MRPRDIRFVALTSLGAIVAIATNALLLNGKRTPAGPASNAQQVQIKTSATRALPPPRDGDVVRRGRFEPTGTAEDMTLPHVPAAEGDPAIIRALKRALNDRGYGPLTAEPTTGLVTRSAILAFEFDYGLPLQGEATEQLLAKMAARIEPKPQTRLTTLRAGTPAAETVVRHVQHKLHALGYLEGRIDGRLSDAMQMAIRRFETDQRLEPRGRISADLVSRLESIPGRS